MYIQCHNPEDSIHLLIEKKKYSNLQKTLDQLQPTYNCKKANWDEFSDILIARESSLLQAIESAISTYNYEEVAYILTTTIKEAADRAIPRKRVSEYSKPWWDDELTHLRKAFNIAYR